MKVTGIAAKVGLLLFVSVAMLGACELVVRSFVTVRNVGPSFTMYDPVYGKRLRPSISVTRITPEFTMQLTTNARGFRQPEVVPYGSHPILFLGDSYTMGYGVSDGEEFVALLRRKLPATEGPLLNAGMGDNGNGRWIKFLTSEGPQYEPRLVVLQLMNNDFDDNAQEGLFLLEDGQLVEQPIPAPGLKRRVQSIMHEFPPLAYSHLMGLLRQVRVPTRQSATGQEAQDNSDELTYRLIKRAIEICEERGWPVLGLSVGLEGERLERARHLFQERGMELLETPSREAGPELYYRVDAHWNPAGHAHVAQMVLNALPEQGARDTDL